MSENKHVNIILMADDDDADSFLIQKALREIDENCQVERYNSGSDLLKALQSRLEIGIPSIVLLDLNMPGLSGTQVLEKLNEKRLTSVFPVLILSTSDNPDDVATTYEHGARAYMNKPGSYAELLRLLRSTHDFWLQSIQKFPQNKIPRETT